MDIALLEGARAVSTFALGFEGVTMVWESIDEDGWTL